MKKTYITKMPDKAGALSKASSIIANQGGNIIRINYNKAVDLHTLFIDVRAKKDELLKITEELTKIGYLTDEEPERQVMLLELKLLDVPGKLQSVLDILNKYQINISYINSHSNKTNFQHFKMGLYIKDPEIEKNLLSDLKKICEVKTLDYSVAEKVVDSDVFYVSFAEEMKKLLNLSRRETNRFIVESNRIMQFLESRNETPFKTFNYIREVAKFMVGHKGENFKPLIDKRKFTDKVTAYIIEPPCGSNIYILDDGTNLLFVDGGFPCFIEETEKEIIKLIPDFKKRNKKIILTHADIDHVGILPLFDEVLVSDNCRINLNLDYEGEDDFREQNVFHAPYCHLSKLISRYEPPRPSKLKVIGRKLDDDILSPIGFLTFGDMEFQLFEGNGGHVKGETIFYDKKDRVIFTGDNFVNIKGFSKDQMEFNAFAPYLMTSVNVNSEEATRCRKLLERWSKGFFVCPGHGMWEQH